jgi:hypothetical protein
MSSRRRVRTALNPQRPRVSFPVGSALPVKQLAVADNHVRALGLAGHGVGAWAKGGMNKWYYRCVPSSHSRSV